VLSGCENAKHYTSKKLLRLMDYDAHLFWYSKHQMDCIRKNDFSGVLRSSESGECEKFPLDGILYAYKHIYEKSDFYKEVLEEILYSFSSETLLPIIIYTSMIN
jgi:hypothetical protein